MNQRTQSFATLIANELHVPMSHIETAITLLGKGDSVPFIARYCGKQTGYLTMEHLHFIKSRLQSAQDLDARRAVISKAIEALNQLTPELSDALSDAPTKMLLEDLYLPYHPKPRAPKEAEKIAHILPFIDSLLKNNKSQADALADATAFIAPDKNIPDAQTALKTARHIIIEQLSENARLLDTLREYLWETTSLNAQKNGQIKKAKAQKFSAYFNFIEPIKKISPHHCLALLKGRKEGVLNLSLIVPEDISAIKQHIMHALLGNDEPLPGTDNFLAETIDIAWKTKLAPQLKPDLLTRMRTIADNEGIRLIGKQFKELLLTPPLGCGMVMGLDAHNRTGLKAVVINETGDIVDYTCVFPFPPHNEWVGAIPELAKLLTRHCVSCVSISNGPQAKHTQRLMIDLMNMYPDLIIKKIIINKAGSFIHIAPPVIEDPALTMDASFYAAASIARSAQNPLPELIKLNTKLISTGYTQYDVNPIRLAHRLNEIIEECANTVRAPVNKASVEWLACISGLNKTIAHQLVTYRQTHGSFRTREDLKQVPQFTDNVFKQAAGFLYIEEGDNPLDALPIHPNTYTLIEKIANQYNVTPKDLIGNAPLLKTISAADFSSETFDTTDIKKILAILETPHDTLENPIPVKIKKQPPKPQSNPLTHLEKGMTCSGVVTRITHFGAFVDIGVHQDGLVHISELTDGYVQDLSHLIKVGDRVSVTILDIDKERRRISLTMRTKNKERLEQKNDPKKNPNHTVESKKIDPKKTAIKKIQKPTQPMPVNTAMADAFKKLTQGKSS